VDSATKSANIAISLIKERMGMRRGKFTVMVVVTSTENTMGGRPAMQAEIFPEDYSGSQLKPAVQWAAAACAENLFAQGRGVIDPNEAFIEAAVLFEDALLTAAEQGFVGYGDDSIEGGRIGGDVGFEKNTEGTG